VVAYQPSWPWTGPAAASLRHWPHSDAVFPEFYANLTVLFSTAAVFFLLLPLANWPLPRRLLRQALPHRDLLPSPVQRVGYVLMWAALVLFALCCFVPGTGAALAWDSYPAGTVFWTADSGNAAVACWLLAIVCVWLAAILAGSGHVGWLLGRSADARRERMPVAARGVLIAAVSQLAVYPCLAAFACAALLDLLSGTAVFLPAGMLLDDAEASTGGGPSLLWQHLLPIAAWPTVLLCCVPLVGLTAAMLGRSGSSSTSEESEFLRIPLPPDGPAKETTDATADRSESANERSVRWLSPTTLGLLLAAALFLITTVVLAVAARSASPHSMPHTREMGLHWGVALACVGCMVASTACINMGAWKVWGAGARAAGVLIVAAGILAMLCGAGVGGRVWSLSQRGLLPWRAEEMVFPHADLEFVSAVRLRVLDIRSKLEQRAADKGVLSPDDEALLDLCNRLHDQLLAPTERAAVRSDDPAVLGAVARAVAGEHVELDENDTLGGDVADLSTLVDDVREQRDVLRLPKVVPGGRVWLVVSYLLSVTFIAYLTVLLTALVAIVMGTVRESRASLLRGLALFWSLGTVFGLCWYFLA
jgi:hypothetical protein